MIQGDEREKPVSTREFTVLEDDGLIGFDLEPVPLVVGDFQPDNIAIHGGIYRVTFIPNWKPFKDLEV